MPIRKGSIYWVEFSSGQNPGTNGLIPGLVIQNDALNSSKLNTVSLLAITTTLKFGELPGNVALEKGEANLPKRCVINATQIKTVNKGCLREKIGALTKERMDQVEAGLKLVLNLA
jgi:mRNA interferase MazF